MNNKKITQLQLKFLNNIEFNTLSDNELIKFGNILIAMFKKSKRIAKSDHKEREDWVAILNLCETHIENLVLSLESSFYLQEEEEGENNRFIINCADLLNKLSYLLFEDEIIYDNFDEKDINLDVYMDILGD